MNLATVKMKREILQHVEKELSWINKPWWYAGHISPLLQSLVDQYKGHELYSIDFDKNQLVGFLYARFDEEEWNAKSEIERVQKLVENAMEVSADTVRSLAVITPIDAEHRLTNCIHGTTEQIMEIFK